MIDYRNGEAVSDNDVGLMMFSIIIINIWTNDTAVEMMIGVFRINQKNTKRERIKSGKKKKNDA